MMPLDGQSQVFQTPNLTGMALHMFAEDDRRSTHLRQCSCIFQRFVKPFEGLENPYKPYRYILLGTIVGFENMFHERFQAISCDLHREASCNPVCLPNPGPNRRTEGQTLGLRPWQQKHMVRVLSFSASSEYLTYCPGGFNAKILHACSDIRNQY